MAIDTPIYQIRKRGSKKSSNLSKVTHWVSGERHSAYFILSSFWAQLCPWHHTLVMLENPRAMSQFSGRLDPWEKSKQILWWGRNLAVGWTLACCLPPSLPHQPSELLSHWELLSQLKSYRCLLWPCGQQSSKPWILLSLISNSWAPALPR
jgi:hypothetical protein